MYDSQPEAVSRAAPTPAGAPPPAASAPPLPARTQEEEEQGGREDEQAGKDMIMARFDEGLGREGLGEEGLEDGGMGEEADTPADPPGTGSGGEGEGAASKGAADKPPEERVALSGTPGRYLCFVTGERWVCAQCLAAVKSQQPQHTALSDCCLTEKQGVCGWMRLQC